MSQYQLVPIIIVAVSLLYVAAVKLKIPAQLVMILGGIGLGLLPALASFELEPFLVFSLLTPPLLYGATVTASVHVLRFNLISAVVPVLCQFGLTVVAVALLSGWLLPGLNWAAAIMLGVITAASGDTFRMARQMLRTPRRVEEYLEVENLVTPIFLVTVFVIVLNATLTGQFSVTDALVRVGLDIVAGSLLGIGLGLTMVWIRRSLKFVPIIEIAVGFGTPYLFSVVAGWLGIYSLPMTIAGGFAVAIAYFRRPASEQGVSSLYRIEANGFWQVMNLLLGGITLFLVGLGLPGAFRKVQASYGWEIILYAILLLFFGQFIRFGVAYFALQTTASGDKTRILPEAITIAWSGVRSFFVVLMVLIIPTTINGQPFGLRDLFVVLVCITTLTSLTIQGMSLPWLVKRLKLAGSPDITQQEQLVRAELAQVALQHLQDYTPTGETERMLVQQLEAHYEGWLISTAATIRKSVAAPVTPNSGGTITATASPSLLKLRQNIAAAKASALRSLRQRNLIQNEVLARFQLELDREAEWLKSPLYTF
jgi:monovalent cation/hydrogen antiporter